ncbi:MAG: nucleotidyltransferase domain-containing protein [Gammaproteobacteria bacterium]|nr:MAG: nucleotidyltransferase domain-containing protein [Gammaproteobacteria bacterium]
MLLNNNDKQTILDILDNDIKNNVELWAFGSRVNNRAHSGSDLDLVIKTKNDKPLDFKEFVDFKESLRESNIPFLVDVMDWNRIPESFKDNIKQQYEVLK